MQLWLHAWSAGLQVGLPFHLGPVVCVGCLADTGPVLRVAILGWGHLSAGGAAVDPRAYDGVNEAVDDGILDTPKVRGLKSITEDCRPTGRRDRSPEDPLVPAAPVRHRLSAYLRHAASTTFCNMIDAATGRATARLQSGPAPTAGASLVSEFNVPGWTSYSYRQRTEAAKRRRMVDAPSQPGARCLNVKLSNEDVCEQMRPRGDL